MPVPQTIPFGSSTDDAGPIEGDTLPEWLANRAAAHPDRSALVFLDEEGGEQTWSYGQLWDRACLVASHLPPAMGREPRALLFYPPGIEFFAGFLGCQIAGWVPVPTCFPKPGRPMPRLDAVAKDCAPGMILGDAESLAALDLGKSCAEVTALPRLATDAIRPDDLNAGGHLRPAAGSAGSAEGLALLQYTSGSTSEPKGVLVRHRNLMANLQAIRHGFRIDWQARDVATPQCGVFWLPFFHDMGLIGGILTPLYLGGCSVLMSPRSFLLRPLKWLRAISDYRAVVSGAPNFAYQLCVDRISPDQTDGLDLSCWATAFCGAEPILPRTLSDFANRFASSGFSESAFCPCYGLAEATLLAAGGRGPAKPKLLTVNRESLRRGKAEVHPEGRGREFQKLVSCGVAAKGTELRVVDPRRRREIGETEIGEIWLRGTSVTGGYWNREEESREWFDAELIGRGCGFLRTGDLGFVHQGELYVTGRCKDVIIVRGKNHFPQDIESTVCQTLGPEAGQVAAFSVEGPRSEALALVAEIPRRTPDCELPELVRDIRRAVIETHEVDPRHVLLVRQATVPLTSSGKVQRGECRERFRRDAIPHKHRFDRVSAGEQTPIAMPPLSASKDDRDPGQIAATVESWLGDWLVARAGVSPDDLAPDKEFKDYGLDSMTAVELSGELEDWSGAELTPIVAMEHPTMRAMSRYIADQLASGRADENATGESPRPAPADRSDQNRSVAKGRVTRA